MRILVMVALFFLAAQSVQAQDSQDSPVFLVVDQPPAYKGGQKGWSKFIKKNLVYPKKARAAGIEGKVFVSFIVEKDGSISKIDVIRAPSEELKKEAIRVVRKSKKWIPGKNKGKTVKCRVQIQLEFKLS